MANADQALLGADRISTLAVATHLVDHGWRAEPSDSSLQVFSKELDGADRRVFAVLPIDSNAPDHRTRIAAALQTISEVEERPLQTILDELESRPERSAPGKELPEFGPGDTVIVNVKVVEGENTRVQAYEGVCIGRSGTGLNESFTVRKISYGEGVERIFPVISPLIDSIKVVRRGKVRRAKLYYLRNLRGKATRIAEKIERAAAQRGDTSKPATDSE